MTPFSTFRGTLKQLSLEGIEEPARINAFQWAFPAFLDPLIEQAGDVPNPSSGAKVRRRRYSGGLIEGLKPLPRGRYSTVCINADGADNGGLCRELSAYAGSVVRQKVRVLDAVKPSNGSGGHWIEVWFDDQDGQILARLGSDGVGSSFSFSTANPGTFAMSLQYTTREVEIGQTIDLRLPPAQDWFVQTFRRELGQAGRFVDALPELISRDLGGSQITDVIGHCLRKMGAAALIYPSARCDARAGIKDGALIDWYGFNLVDFREAGEPAQAADPTPERLFADLGPWRSHFDWPGARCLAVDPSDASPLRLNGSWHLAGVEQSHQEFFHAGGMLGGREGGDWKGIELDTRGAFLQQVLMRLGASRTASGDGLFDPEEFRVDLNRPDGELLHQAVQLHAIATALSSRGHSEKASYVWTQSADALRKVAAAKDAGVAQAARLKLGSMLHQAVVERMAAGDNASALVVGEEALLMLKPHPASEAHVADASATSPSSAQVSAMIRSEYGRCLNNLGSVRSGEGQPEAARQLFEEAIAVDRTLATDGDDARLELARALQNYSAVSLSMGDAQEAFEAANEAAGICREASHRDDPLSLRTRRGALHYLQAALTGLAEFDRAREVSIEFLTHVFHAMHVTPELVDEFKLDPLRISISYATAGRYDIAKAIADQAIAGYEAALPADPGRFTDLLEKAHLLQAALPQPP